MASGDDWSDAENEATVASYLSMLELEGKPFTKTVENARLREHLDGRTKGAVEYKYQNISAVLLDNRRLYIDGYKPYRNFQQPLRDEVERQLRLDTELDNLIENLVEAPTDPNGEAARHDSVPQRPAGALVGDLNEEGVAGRHNLTVPAR